jgi:uncharacterized protein (DUF305 family)
MHVRFFAALAAVVALTATACGSDQQTTTENSREASGNGVDRAFVAEMIPHHASAVEMAEMARTRGESDFVKQLADDIIRSQNEEIATMREKDAQLAQAGVERGELGVSGHQTGMDMDLSALETADPFDDAFLRMMIPHHEGAVTMSRAELERGSDGELEQLAREIIEAQEREIGDMRRELGDGAGGTDTDDEHGSH